MSSPRLGWASRAFPKALVQCFEKANTSQGWSNSIDYRFRASQYRAYAYLSSMRHYPELRPIDDRDIAKDVARDLAEIASHLGQLKGDANAHLTDPKYNTLKLRLEGAHSAVEAAAVEARRRVRLNKGS